MFMASEFEIRAVMAPGHSRNEAVDGIVAALRRFQGEVSDAEIQRARLAFQRSTLFALESSLGLASQITTLTRFGPLPETYDGSAGRYAAVTERGVRDAVRNWLGLRPWVIVFVHRNRSMPFAGVVEDREVRP
jgi:predicted Zn-dependent peptidase